MASSKELSENKNQHIIKNLKSRKQDKKILKSVENIINYLNTEYKELLDQNNLKISWSNHISLIEMFEYIKNFNIRKDFNYKYIEENKKRGIKPDGGVIYLYNDDGFKKILLVSEYKRQGTNDKRLKMGLKTQAVGNAIERLGKNLTAIKTIFNHDRITPFVCFGSGWDFKDNYGFCMGKIFCLNEFYDLNKIYIFKKDGTKDNNYFSPVSMFFRHEVWTVKEMFEIMKEIVDTTIRYYVY